MLARNIEGALRNRTNARVIEHCSDGLRNRTGYFLSSLESKMDGGHLIEIYQGNGGRHVGSLA